MNEEYSFAIGMQETAVWSTGTGTGDGPSITYTHGEKLVRVILQCSSTEVAEFEVLGEGPTNVYTFSLTHKCACWNGCSSK